MQQQIPWRRRLFALDKPPFQGCYRWLPDGYESEMGVLLAHERATALIVVCGERGMGKTYALRQEHDALQAAGLHAAWLELRRCTTTGLAQKRLRTALTPPAEPGEWHVLLDGLDEGLNDLPQLDQFLEEVLEELPEPDRARMRLRITCRSARWPARFEEALRTRWQPDQIKIMGLVPLSADDVAVAAQAVGIADTGVLLEAIRQQRLVALATHPVTLLQLLDSYAAHTRLPATVHEAYLQACLRLCAEHRRFTDPHQMKTQTSPEHLLAVAARLAAALQFGPYTVVADAPVTDAAAASVELRLSRLDGFDEPGHLGGRVPCTLWDLRQVTESSLLVPTGDLRWVFAQDSYREFLAAHFLRMHRLQPEPLRQLLWIGDGQDRHVIPAHQEVAAWLATSDATLFADLLRDAPLVLLLADLPSLPDTERERTVTALFDWLERDDERSYLALAAPPLHRLNHAGLSKQLRPRLQTTNPKRLLDAAVAIAQACRPPGLNDELLTAAEDTRQGWILRAQALAALTEPAPHTLSRLMKLAHDTSSEVAVAALRHLYPGHLTVTDYLDRLCDLDPGSRIVSYFLRREVPRQLDTDTIAEAVAWAGRHVQAGRIRPAYLAVAVPARAIILNERTPALTLVPLISESLLALAADEDLLLSATLQTHLQDLAQVLDDCPHTRRLLARHVLHHSDDDLFTTLLASTPGQSLIPEADLLYWMEHWDQLAAISPARAQQVVRFAPPADPDANARADAARRAHPALATATQFWDRHLADQQRRAAQAERQRQQNRFDQAALDAALDDVLAARGEDSLTAWTHVLRCLRRTPDGSPPGVRSPLVLPARAPTRPDAENGAARRISQAAAHLLTENPPRAVIQHPSRLIKYSLHIAATAFALIDEPATLRASPAHWGGWAVVLASRMTDHADDVAIKCTWIPLCVERAADQMSPLLKTALDRAENHTLRELTRVLGGPASYGLRPVLHTWALHPDRSPDQWYTVLNELAAADDPEALSSLAQAIETDPHEHGPGSPARHRWLNAVRVLLRHHSLPDHWPVLRRGLSDVTILLEHEGLLDDLSYASDGRSFPHLTEDVLVELHRLIVDHVGIERAQQWAHDGSSDSRLLPLLGFVCRVLASRATHPAASALYRLARHYPQLPQLARYARSTARAATDRSVQPLEPEQLIRLATDHQARLVRDPRQLLDLVRESLTALEKDLQGSNGTAITLWNRDRPRFNSATQCWPCWEDDLSDAVASFLRRDIGGHRVVVNREVQVRRDGLPGLRTDIQIEAPAHPDTGQQTLTVVIEVKGCWNPELPTAQTQLRAYLSEPDTAGLLLVGYFDCTRWNTKKRSCPATNHAIDDVRREQHEQIRQLTDDGTLLAAAHVLDCRLPGEDSDWRKTADGPA
ncbi:hypothetical protein PO587_39130 [Streptomyces gilvifuscus]|uniref:ATP-binding protein n=1 Tax=Streptomyces gilvifuscus TaxID=1550617 RepID=A0ABT5G6T1_9ACTN|nr:hypothetical protein [Streptomyces gilvifuscus]MDC2960453.1 hypothetical protein [Streptomyces gilvifuscus]